MIKSRETAEKVQTYVYRESKKLIIQCPIFWDQRSLISFCLPVSYFPFSQSTSNRPGLDIKNMNIASQQNQTNGQIFSVKWILHILIWLVIVIMMIRNIATDGLGSARIPDTQTRY